MNIRNVTLNDIEIIHSIESECFPPDQAASLNVISDRIKAYPQHFWLIAEDDKIIGFINGMITNHDTIKDEMFKNVKSVHGGDVFHDMRLEF